MTLLRTVPAFVTAMLVGLVCPTFVTPATAVTALTVSGTGTWFHPPPFPEELLPAFFAGTTISRVDYPATVTGMDRSIAIAAEAIGRGVLNTAEPVIAAGFSQGALAVAYAKKDLMALPADLRPAPDRLSFLTIGDPSGPGGILRSVRMRVPLIGLTPIIPPDTPYDTVIVNGEYDGWADFPDRPWNPASLANAVLGIVYVHGRYETVPGGLDPSTGPPANVTTTVNNLGGTTTTYLIPTAKLPLVQPLRDVGISEEVVTAIEKPLKKAVDRGYARNDPAPAQPGAAAAVRAAPRQIRQPERRGTGQSRDRSAGRSAA